MKTKLQVLTETVEFYAEDPSRRAYDSVLGCQYELCDGSGRSCAVGRCLVDPKDIQSQVRSSGSITHLFGNGVVGLDSFKEDYKIDDKYFWSALQEMHDHGRFWDETGLSNQGTEQYEFLKEKYKDE